jgi:hypothetical protein
MRSPTVPAVLAGLAVLGVTSGAQAFERQWHVGGGAGVATFAARDVKAGPLAGIHAAYGISDTFDVRAAWFGSLHHLDDERFSIGAVTAGLAYKLDVLALVPYAGLQVGYYRLSSSGARPGSLGRHEPGFSADLGLDYAVRRHLGLGFELRFHGFLSDPLSSLGDAPYFTGMLRAEYRWGW